MFFSSRVFCWLVVCFAGFVSVCGMLEVCLMVFTHAKWRVDGDLVMASNLIISTFLSVVLGLVVFCLVGFATSVVVVWVMGICLC
jgi:hypothetical protein